MRDYPPEQIVKALFPFLERPLWDEWDLIKQKKSNLSSAKRKRISELCLKIEAQDKKKQEMVE